VTFGFKSDLHEVPPEDAEAILAKAQELPELWRALAKFIRQPCTAKRVRDCAKELEAIVGKK
jgi:hypothetical protein